jgi:hypothetical protein
MRESKIENEIIKYAEKNGYDQYKFKSSVRGVPDRLFITPQGCTCGGVFFIEFKRPKKELEVLQEYWADQFRAKGIQVYCGNNIKKAKGIIDGKKIDKI